MAHSISTQTREALSGVWRTCGSFGINLGPRIQVVRNHISSGYNAMTNSLSHNQIIVACGQRLVLAKEGAQRVCSVSLTTVAWVANRVATAILISMPYIAGPLTALVTLTVTILSFGKRYPGVLPVQLGLGIGVASMIAVWAFQYFTHPRTQRILAEQGVGEAVRHIIPAQAVTPLYIGMFKSFIFLKEFFYETPDFKCPVVTINELKKSLAGMKHLVKSYQDLVARGKSSDSARGILKEELFKLAKDSIKRAVFCGDKAQMDLFVTWFKEDPFMKDLFTAEDRVELENMGYRLAYMLNKNELLGTIPFVSETSTLKMLVEGIILKDEERVTAITNSQEFDANTSLAELHSDPVFNLLGINVGRFNLLQWTVFKGNFTNLQKIVSSSRTPIDFTVRDSQGTSLLQLAAMSGSTPVWEYMYEQMNKVFPAVGSQEHLMLLYAAVKGNNPEILNQILNPAIEHIVQPVSSLLEDLFEESVAMGSDKIREMLRPKVTSIYSTVDGSIERLAQAAAFGGNKEIYRYCIEVLEGRVHYKTVWALALTGKGLEASIAVDLLKRCPQEELDLKAEIDQVNRTCLLEVLKGLSVPECTKFIKMLPKAFLETLFEKEEMRLNVWLKTPEFLFLALERLKASIGLIKQLALDCIKISEKTILAQLVEANPTICTMELMDYALLSLDITIVRMLLSKASLVKEDQDRIRKKLKDLKEMDPRLEAYETDVCGILEGLSLASAAPKPPVDRHAELVSDAAKMADMVHPETPESAPESVGIIWRVLGY